MRSAIAEKHMLHANFMAVCSIEPELLPIKVLHCGNEDFYAFVPVSDLNIEPMTFIYELDPNPLEINRMCENELFMSR